MSRWGVEVQVEGLSIIGVYAPLPGTLRSPAHQREFWRAFHRLAEERLHELVLVVGDYNTCAPGTDGPNALACSEAFEHLSTLGWVDAWRASNPGAQDFSYVHRTNGGTSNWRIDHAFASLPLASAITSCRYSHEQREAGLSDHSMLLLELE